MRIHRSNSHYSISPPTHFLFVSSTKEFHLTISSQPKNSRLGRVIRFFARRSFSGLALRVCLLIVGTASVGRGEVVRVEVTDRFDVMGAWPFGSVGAYEAITGRIYFAASPSKISNQVIADIQLAPQNARGQVEYSSDFYILRPRDPAKGNHTVLFEVVNRGRKGTLEMFHFTKAANDLRGQKDFGDDFLLERGYTLAWLGWQFDVPDDKTLLRLYPAVVKGITGLVRSEFVPSSHVTSFPLADRNHKPYAVIEPNDASVNLTVRERSESSRTVIPRTQWKFNGANVEMSSGFEPGKFYEVVYKSQDPPVVGLGLAAVRDFMSYLKYGGSATGALADEHSHIKRTIGFGTSQSGRFLRTLLYFGMNADEQGRQVFDAVWAHVAGAGRGSFNHRFAQPSRDGHMMLNTLYPTDLFPFSDLPQTDTDTRLTEGLLDRARSAKVVPKIFYTNGSYEYWGRGAALIHITLDGRRDMEIPDTTRIYFLTGTQHTYGTFPSGRGNTQNFANPNDYRYLMRALLTDLNDWITTGTLPPASNYPRLANKELVSPDSVRFPRIPNVNFPNRLYRVWQLDFGPDFRTKGIVSFDPPRIGKAYPALVPQTESNGNESVGLRLPELQVPLGTYAGWNLRDPKIGAPDSLYDMVGSFIPFVPTKAERFAKKDPRPSIEELYPNQEAYITKIHAASEALVQSRYLLETDVPRISQRAVDQWTRLSKSK